MRVERRRRRRPRWKGSGEETGGEAEGLSGKRRRPLGAARTVRMIWERARRGRTVRMVRVGVVSTWRGMVEVVDRPGRCRDSRPDQRAEPPHRPVRPARRYGY